MPISGPCSASAIMAALTSRGTAGVPAINRADSIRQTASTVRWVAVAPTQSSPGARWIGRTSIVSPSRAGQRAAHCTASSFDDAWMTQ